MKNLTLAERWEKHGKAWRYVYFLELELEARKTRQSFIRISLALNVALIVTVIYLILGGGK